MQFYRRILASPVKEAFSKTRERNQVEQETLVGNLYEQIGRLQTELNWLKKKFGVDD